nr:MAG TPA: hypothetical protein [Caudoviricetes sp.]
MTSYACMGGARSLLPSAATVKSPVKTKKVLTAGLYKGGTAFSF